MITIIYLPLPRRRTKNAARGDSRGAFLPRNRFCPSGGAWTSTAKFVTVLRLIVCNAPSYSTGLSSRIAKTKLSKQNRILQYLSGQKSRKKIITLDKNSKGIIRNFNFFKFLSLLERLAKVQKKKKMIQIKYHLGPITYFLRNYISKDQSNSSTRYSKKCFQKQKKTLVK